MSKSIIITQKDEDEDYLKLDKIHIPKKITLNVNQTIESIMNHGTLDEAMDVDFPRSTFVQDGFVVRSPNFVSIAAKQVRTHLLWLCTQGIQQVCFIKLYELFQTINPDYSLKQSLHQRYTKINDQTIERFMCCDLIKHSFETGIEILHHICLCLVIRWDDVGGIFAIELQIQ